MKGRLAGAVLSILSALGPPSTFDASQGEPMTPEQRRERREEREERAVTAIPKAEEKRLRKKMRNLANAHLSKRGKRR